ncbi:MAG: cyclase family protein [Pelagibacterales bacterium]|nr:cyclase family protein [Pelagibacterales bacterium]
MNKIIFMSHPLTEDTPTYGDRDQISISPKSQIIDGIGANTTTINFSNNHMGTHVDTPFHFCMDGKKTLDYGADDFYYTKVAVVNCPCKEAKLIKREDLNLDNVPKDVDFLLINMDYEQYRSEDKYHNDNPGLHASLAYELREEFKDLKIIGFDAISLTSWKYRKEGREGHRAFLCGKHPFLIIEDVSFKDLANNEIDWAVVAPLRTIDGNGGPVTIISKIK